MQVLKAPSLVHYGIGAFSRPILMAWAMHMIWSIHHTQIDFKEELKVQRDVLHLIKKLSHWQWKLNQRLYRLINFLSVDSTFIDTKYNFYFKFLQKNLKAHLRQGVHLIIEHNYW